MNREWIEKQWQGVKLGDKRLVKRALKIGMACLETPDGSLPKKFGSWGDAKGAHRFFNSKGVSHEALQKVHIKMLSNTHLKLKKWFFSSKMAQSLSIILIDALEGLAPLRMLLDKASCFILL
jgi:hypothetical protein